MFGPCNGRGMFKDTVERQHPLGTTLRVLADRIYRTRGKLICGRAGHQPCRLTEKKDILISYHEIN